ncbi:AzlD domain-containing protein [Schumannella luteola]
MLEILAVVISGVVTFATRVVFLVDKRVRPPKRVVRYLPLIGPAVLAAIAVPGILAPRGALTWYDSVPAVLAAVVSWGLWRWSRQTWVGLLGGLVTWWAVLAVLAALGVTR